MTNCPGARERRIGRSSVSVTVSAVSRSRRDAPGADDEVGSTASPRPGSTARERRGVSGGRGGGDRHAAPRARRCPTGHQVMQRPQPTQPDDPNWSHQVRELVGQPLAVAVAAAGAGSCRRRRGRTQGEAAVPRSARWRRRRRRGPSRLRDAGAEARGADEGAVARRRGSARRPAAQRGWSSCAEEAVVQPRGRRPGRRSARRVAATAAAAVRATVGSAGAQAAAASTSAAPAGDPAATTNPSSSSVSARS